MNHQEFNEAMLQLYDSEGSGSERILGGIAALGHLMIKQNESLEEINRRLAVKK